MRDVLERAAPGPLLALTLQGDPPARAELDDAAYVDVKPVLQVRPLAQSKLR